MPVAGEQERHWNDLQELGPDEGVMGRLWKRGRACGHRCWAAGSGAQFWGRGAGSAVSGGSHGRDRGQKGGVTREGQREGPEGAGEEGRVSGGGDFPRAPPGQPGSQGGGAGRGQDTRSPGGMEEVEEMMGTEGVQCAESLEVTRGIGCGGQLCGRLRSQGAVGGVEPGCCGPWPPSTSGDVWAGTLVGAQGQLAVGLPRLRPVLPCTHPVEGVGPSRALTWPRSLLCLLYQVSGRSLFLNKNQ